MQFLKDGVQTVIDTKTFSFHLVIKDNEMSLLAASD